MSDDRRRSEVWKFFKVIESNQEKKKVECSMCYTELTYSGGSTGTMTNHLRLKHSEVFIASQARYRSTRSCKSTYTRRTNQPVIVSHSSLMAKDEWEKCTAKLAAMCAFDLRPISIVEGTGFKEFIKELNPLYEVPDRATVAHFVRLQYEEEKQTLREKLANQVGMAFTLDLWVSVATEAYVTVTTHFLDENWELNNCILATKEVEEQHTGLNISTEIRKLLTEFDIPEKKIYGLVTENSANMVNCGNGLGWPQVKCFGHTLQLSIRGAFDEVRALSDTIAAAKMLVAYFHGSASATLELQSQQKQLELSEHILITDCTSRWNTTFDMFECLVRERLNIHAVLNCPEVTKPSDAMNLTLSDSQWDIIEAMVPVLRPLHVATRIMCSQEYPTLSGVYPILCSLKNQHLRVKETDIEAVADFKRIVVSVLEMCYNTADEVLCQDPALICTFLDPRYKSLLFLKPSQREAVRAQVVSYMQSDGPPGQSRSLRSSAKRLKSDHSQSDMAFLLGEYYQDGDDSDSSPTPEEELGQYVLSKAVPTAVNPIAWWKENSTSFPAVAKLARKFLCIPATAVPSERVFSTAGDTLTKLRASLDPDTVSELIFVNKVLRTKEPQQDTDEARSAEREDTFTLQHQVLIKQEDCSS
ncbi:E3 SUMO-protein ligase ZBED1-like [Polyodon spathula]|uniref:E3 SUMO-protein ligase ZBED1-like n=1 Tax=Polyodon spathula TaxID=7913 RepID=UPI001B7E9EC2|nr:E3 SUMO-protein ligase ZBED1-like [Polyodon spathula]